MRFGEVLSAIFCLLITITVASGIPDPARVEEVTLEYIRSSQNYKDNGGFGALVLDSKVGEDVSVVIVEYQTRHVGMLQYIGHFVSHVTINSTSMEVISCETEETHMTVDPLEPGNSSEPVNDPDPEPGDPDEGYRMKILYTINATRATIYGNDAEDELAEAINMLDRALDLIERGEYDEALALAIEADEMVNERIPGSGGEDPGKDPSSTPWLYGYVVVFDHEPMEDDWQDLRSLFNATLMMEADDYTGSEHAYWVQVPDTRPDDIKKVDGIRDVLVFRGAPGGNPGDGDEAKVTEFLPLPVALFMGLAWLRSGS